jgi:hypothetical protein
VPLIPDNRCAAADCDSVLLSRASRTCNTCHKYSSRTRDRSDVARRMEGKTRLLRKGQSSSRPPNVAFQQCVSWHAQTQSKIEINGWRQGVAESRRASGNRIAARLAGSGRQSPVKQPHCICNATQGLPPWHSVKQLGAGELRGRGDGPVRAAVSLLQHPAHKQPPQGLRCLQIHMQREKQAVSAACAAVLGRFATRSASLMPPAPRLLARAALPWA